MIAWHWINKVWLQKNLGNMLFNEEDVFKNIFIHMPHLFDLWGESCKINKKHTWSRKLCVGQLRHLSTNFRSTCNRGRSGEIRWRGDFSGRGYLSVSKRVISASKSKAIEGGRFIFQLSMISMQLDFLSKPYVGRALVVLKKSSPPRAPPPLVSQLCL